MDNLDRSETPLSEENLDTIDGISGSNITIRARAGTNTFAAGGHDGTYPPIVATEGVTTRHRAALQRRGEVPPANDPPPILQQFLSLPRPSHQAPPGIIEPPDSPLYATRAGTAVHFDLSEHEPPLFTEPQRTLPGTPRPRQTLPPPQGSPIAATPDITRGRTATTPTEDTALTAIATELCRIDQDYASMLAELQWQRASMQDVKAFRTETLQTQDLRVFVFMRPNSCLLNFLHSAASFYAPNAPPDLRGKDIGFDGDKTGFQTPHRRLAPTRKTVAMGTKIVIPK